jgi:TetR/AcrR family transcriptional repressor of nem operon
LERLRLWFQDTLECLKEDDMRRGCLYANMSAEAIEHGEPMRRRIAGIFAENAPISTSPTLRGSSSPHFEGAILIAKAQRDPAPIERFVRVLFSSVLRRSPAKQKSRARSR